MADFSFDITVIGAGVVGLAVAEALSARYKNILLIEKHHSFGMETSSRNSEVVHAGIYYPIDSLKARFCREGNRRLYEICTARIIGHRKTGKLIVAVSEDEINSLEALRIHAVENGVFDLCFLGSREIARSEPEISVKEALFSPSTGIVDSHALMRSFLARAESQGTTVVFNTEITAIDFDGSAYEIETNSGEFRFKTGILINSAGLSADRIAALAGIDIDGAGYRLKYCKGNYFTVSPVPKLHHLIYPVPTGNREGLGIHATLDLGGRVRFGPDTEYIMDIDYTVHEEKKDAFYRSIRRYLPGITAELLTPDMSGIRPKLQGPGEPYKDFIIQEERHKGYPGLITLNGIESPGLTASIPIAEYVASLVEKSLDYGR